MGKKNKTPTRVNMDGKGTWLLDRTAHRLLARSTRVFKRPVKLHRRANNRKWPNELGMAPNELRHFRLWNHEQNRLKNIAKRKVA